MSNLVRLKPKQKVWFDEFTRAHNLKGSTGMEVIVEFFKRLDHEQRRQAIELVRKPRMYS